MQPQNYEEKRHRIREAFKKKLKENPALKNEQIKLSWSNWGFGMEGLEISAQRLARAGIGYIELHGNHYGPDLGYEVDETLKILTEPWAQKAWVHYNTSDPRSHRTPGEGRHRYQAGISSFFSSITHHLDLVGRPQSSSVSGPKTILPKSSGVK